MRGYHVTSEKKYKKYLKSGRILAPVRFFPDLIRARQWAHRVKRTVLLEIEVDEAEAEVIPDFRTAYQVNRDVSTWSEL